MMREAAAVGLRSVVGGAPSHLEEGVEASLI